MGLGEQRLLPVFLSCACDMLLLPFLWLAYWDKIQVLRKCLYTDASLIDKIILQCGKGCLLHFAMPFFQLVICWLHLESTRNAVLLKPMSALL